MINSECEINKFGTKFWRINKGLLHREDGPAVEYTSGHKEWWVKGKLHRLEGPAVERHDGIKEWWVNNITCSTREFPFVVIMFLLNCDKEVAEIILEQINV
jgi:hypothetical protein